MRLSKFWGVGLVSLLLSLGGSVSYRYRHQSTLPTGSVNVPVMVSEPLQLPRFPNAIDFQGQIEPLLQQRCLACHLSMRELASTLRRPFKQVCEEYLDEDQRVHFLQWIQRDAFLPVQQPQFASDWDSQESSHWAFAPLGQVSLPVQPSDQSARHEHPIDAFLAERIRAEQTDWEPPADRATQVRRLTFAVTGLPPTVEQLDRWSVGNEPLEPFVDELLDSPFYGEHWASFWLDLVRYADTNGYEDDGIKPLAWKYRDFVIRSFNQDLPYDQFVMMQLAGDLQINPTEDDYIAAGFLRLGGWDSEPNDELVSYLDQVDDMVSTTGTVFIGLSVGCARCHDHPEEPISSHDYARFAACFHGLHRPIRGRLEQPAVSATADEVVKTQQIQHQVRVLQRRALLANNRHHAAQFRSQAARLEASVPNDRAYRFVETDRSLEPAFWLKRGDPGQPREQLAAGMLSVLASAPFNDHELPRLQLAKSLINDQKGLLARVLVNRLWAWHFGRGLVTSTGNLGLSGQPATHPELLQWLANWFVNEANWSIKSLNRLILTSRPYRSSVSQQARQTELYAAYPSTRLRAEMIHDALLSIAGCDRWGRFGPPVHWETFGHHQLDASSSDNGELDLQNGRRAIYMMVKRNTPEPLLASFDFPDRSSCRSTRHASCSARQALDLWNGPLAGVCARYLAQRVARESQQLKCNPVEYAFRVAIGRLPDEAEAKAMQRFMNRAPEDELGAEHDPEASVDERLEQLCLVLLNLHEFSSLQ